MVVVQNYARVKLRQGPWHSQPTKIQGSREPYPNSFHVNMPLVQALSTLNDVMEISWWNESTTNL